MSVVAFIRDLISRGLDMDTALKAAEAFEAAPSARSKGAERQRRYRERHQPSQPVTRDASDASDALVSPSPLSPKPPNPTPPSGSVTTRARGAAFEVFWAEYPRKVGKPKAEAAFRQALQRLAGPDPPSVIMLGLRAQLPGWAQREPDLIPHPTTWLNRDGWDDQPDTPRNLRVVTGHERSRPSRSDFSDNLDRAFSGSEIAIGARNR